MLTANFTDNVKNMPRQGLQKRTIEGVSVARFENRSEACGRGVGGGGVADISGSRVLCGTAVGDGVLRAGAVLTEGRKVCQTLRATTTTINSSSKPMNITKLKSTASGTARPERLMLFFEDMEN